MSGLGSRDMGVKIVDQNVASPANLPLTKMVTVFHLFFFNELIDYVI